MGDAGQELGKERRRRKGIQKRWAETLSNGNCKNNNEVTKPEAKKEGRNKEENVSLIF